MPLVQPRLAGKRALVTGGGEGSARRVRGSWRRRERGVVVCGRTAVEIDAVAKQVGGEAIVVDFARSQGYRCADRNARRIDILVNNAGVAESASLDKTSDAMWDRILELDATAPFRLVTPSSPRSIAEAPREADHRVLRGQYRVTRSRAAAFDAM